MAPHGRRGGTHVFQSDLYADGRSRSIEVEGTAHLLTLFVPHSTEGVTLQSASWERISGDVTFASESTTSDGKVLVTLSGQGEAKVTLTYSDGLIEVLPFTVTEPIDGDASRDYR